jgi:hypothetical protein
MKVLHPDPRPTAPRPRALPPGWLTVAFALAALLVAGCTDDVTANCPPLAHPEVLTVAAAAGNPCGARKGESAQQLRDRVLKTYRRSQPPGASSYPLRCGNSTFGYLHLLSRATAGEGDHCDPLNDQSGDNLIAGTLEHGAYASQVSGNPRYTLRFNGAQSACHGGDWGFRVVVGGGTFSYAGIITAFRLKGAPPTYP